MLVLGIGLLFWILAGVAAARLVVISRADGGVARVAPWLWALCLAAAALLLFRPHEDIFGGQDQGDYVNAAATFARNGTLTSGNSLLARVPVADRNEFRYRGHHNRRQPTSLGVLMLKDMGRATEGPYFQPSYSILMSVAVRLGSPRWAFYVAPLFALLTGIALAVLAGFLFEHKWAGLAAFVLYISNPVTAWHGRCARAELVASFFVFAAGVLLIRAWSDRSRPAWIDVLLGALCAAVAPFFHITAWMVLIPVSLVVAAVAARGRSAFSVYLLVLAAGLSAFLVQARYVTDPYRFHKTAGFLLEHVWAVAAVLPACAFLLSIVSFARARKQGGDVGAGEAHQRLFAIAGIVAAVLTGAILLFACLGENVAGRSVGGATSMRLTEVGAFLKVMTGFMAVCGLAGWTILLARRGPAQPLRLLTGVVLFPGMIFMGSMPIYMYFLRRALPFLVPAFVLSLTALVVLVADRIRLGRRAVAFIVAALVIGGAYGRIPLYTTVEYRGLVDFMETCAGDMDGGDGILLCEYSRIAAPFGHLLGIPTLGIDNEHVHDYARIETAWDAIIRDNPGKPAFFATPFARTPLGEKLAFEPVSQRTYSGLALESRNNGVPRGTSPRNITLSIYRVRDREASAGHGAAEFPYQLRFDAGNMGLKDFGKTYPQKGAKATGLLLEPGKPVVFTVPRAATDGRMPDLMLVALGGSSDTIPSLRVDAADGSVLTTAGMTRIADDWWLCRLDGAAFAGDGRVAVNAQEAVLLTDVFCIEETGALRELALEEAGVSAGATRDVRRFVARRALGKSKFLVPCPEAGKGFVLLYVRGERSSDFVSLRLDGQGSEAGAAMSLSDDQWQWIAWPVETPVPGNAVAWASLREQGQGTVLAGYGIVTTNTWRANLPRRGVVPSAQAQRDEDGR